MPARPKTSTAAIVDAAILLIDECGLDALSMNEVAAAVGIRAPSLYRHFADRAELLRAAEARLLEDLADRIGGCATDPADPFLAMAFAYRAFALAHPRAYALLFASELRGAEGTRLRERAAKPALDALTARLGSPGAALIAARAFTAFCHGFVSMELAGEFRLGGDVDEAFVGGLRILQAGMSARASQPQPAEAHVADAQSESSPNP